MVTNMSKELEPCELIQAPAIPKTIENLKETTSRLRGSLHRLGEKLINVLKPEDGDLNNAVTSVSHEVPLVRELISIQDLIEDEIRFINNLIDGIEL